MLKISGGAREIERNGTLTAPIGRSVTKTMSVNNFELGKDVADHQAREHLIGDPGASATALVAEPITTDTAH
jgi:hypothetical protein